MRSPAGYKTFVNEPETIIAAQTAGGAAIDGRAAATQFIERS